MLDIEPEDHTIKTLSGLHLWRAPKVLTSATLEVCKTHRSGRSVNNST